MTCYATPGDPERGRYLTTMHGWESGWPHGPARVDPGDSVTVLDRIADGHLTGLRRTRLPSADDATELQLVLPFLERAKEQVTPTSRAMKALPWALAQAEAAYAAGSPWEVADALSHVAATHDFGYSQQKPIGYVQFGDIWPGPYDPVGTKEIAARAGVHTDYRR